jgi:hypothetical protein
MGPIFGTLVHGGVPHPFLIALCRLVFAFMVIPWLGGADTRVLGSKWVYHGLKHTQPPWMGPIFGTLVHGGVPHPFWLGVSRLGLTFMVIPWLGGADTRVLGSKWSTMA